MSRKVGANGQVVIPKAIRDQVGIQPGDEVTFEIDGNAVCVRRKAGKERRYSACLSDLSDPGASRTP